MSGKDWEVSACCDLAELQCIPVWFELVRVCAGVHAPVAMHFGLSTTSARENLEKGLDSRMLLEALKLLVGAPLVNR